MNVPPTLQRLEIGGVVLADLSRCAIRWMGNGPVLYLDGRRVTRPWSLVLNVERGEEKDVSTNTA